MALTQTIDRSIADGLRDLLSDPAHAAGSKWHLAQRHKALARFESLGLPHKQEHWKYTRVAALLPDGVVPSRTSEMVVPNSIPKIDGLVVTLENGRLVSTPEHLPKGMTVCPLSEALERFPELVEKYLDRLASQDDAFAAMNMASTDEALFVRIAKGVSISPALHILNLFGSDQTAMLHSRQLIVVEENASLTVVEHDEHSGSARSFTNATVEVAVGPGGRLNHYRLQRKPGADHVDSTAVRMEAGATYKSFVVSTGDRVIRNNLDVVAAGPGCETHLFGLFFAEGKAQIDNHTLIDHAEPDCTSRELYKGILAGDAVGTFRGMLLVRKDAQRTSAFQSNRNLLLSETASVNALPQLEIYADDVKCSHGATTGLLEPDALFYLRARGIPERRARRMLVEAFMAEITDEIEESVARGVVTDVLTKFLAGVRETA
ncbi:MAG TPA: Fe-S cluster assembly protein SufD [Rhodothermales bacterium]